MKSYKYRGIYTNREVATWQSWQLVFDWEDIFSEKMNLPLLSTKRKWYQRRRSGHYILRYIFSKLRLEKIYKPKGLYIYHQMLIQNDLDYSPWMLCQMVPWIIDGFVEKSELKGLHNKFKYCPFLLISSLESYNYLKANKFPMKFYFAPLSLSDKYRSNLNDETSFPKKYDLISAGRINPILEKYIQQYLIENKNLNFIHCKIDHEGNFHYYSNQTGEIGTYNTREEYMDLLKDCKIGLYSTPAIDGGSRNNNKGFNPVTPRFFELISSQCHIISRYPDTEETRFFDLKQITLSTTSYEHFKEQIDKYLSLPVDKEKYRNYLNNHYTSTRIKYLEKDIQEFNLSNT